MLTARFAISLAAVLTLAPSSALAQEAFTGTWKITRFIPAPWADPATGKLPNQDSRQLMGKTITFTPKAVLGPVPYACKNPKYEIRKDDGPEMLFQGALAEEDYAGKKHDPADLARGIGMTTPTVQTLADACSEMEFHLLSPNELVFGLNDHVYVLERAAGH